MNPPPPPAPEPAKPTKAAYRRNLPHFQAAGRPLFVTFSTWQRWELPESVRGLVLKHCLHDHRARLDMTAAIVMPDHVHLLLSARTDGLGNTYGLSQLLGGIKGASAHSVNRALGRQGYVWQDESFDHVIRCDEDIREKAEYICQNPMRKGLVDRIEDYPWLWREWVEGKI